MFLLRPESGHSGGADGGMARRSYHDRRGALHAFYNVWSRRLLVRASALGFLSAGMGAGAAMTSCSQPLETGTRILQDWEHGEPSLAARRVEGQPT